MLSYVAIRKLKYEIAHCAKWSVWNRNGTISNCYNNAV
ncbi:hypothetical protein MBEBAB_0928 [Brevundimonas abyssalis TAR-001]|uniref:Uncharacterized protein n=1 Tax=Brevundimonas abyssalis TAR-001 TaxID=1391729 RepID=A0A8E0NAX9_9CAUL|nr:hypothetical protein MBEBAB_0928 [Brevundimonas abyssalis TAR-001]